MQGPSFPVGHAGTALRRPGGRLIPVEAWYPAEAAGEGRPAAHAAVPAPAVAFGHGHLVHARSYATTLQRLATAGIVVVAPDTESRLFPDHAALAGDLRRCLDWLTSGAAGVPALSGVADGARLGLVGHSLGGGCALLAAADDGRVRSVATLAAARTRPSAMRAAGRLRVPVLFVGAERDAITPVRLHQRPLFRAIRPGTPAQLRVVSGGTHAGFLDELRPWRLPGRRHGTIGRPAQRALVGDLLVAWLLHTLAGREELWESVWGQASVLGRRVVVETRSPPPHPRAR